MKKHFKNDKITLVFDLDETVINSSHRTPNNSDGTLNLEAYRAKHTPENVAKDTLLPLAQVMQKSIQQGYNVAILTARDMKQCDYEFLEKHGIKPRFIYSRDKCKTRKHYNMGDGLYKLTWLAKMASKLLKNHLVIFDDSKAVKSTLRKNGFTVVCPHKINKKLAQ